jgi:hypothetical protein
MPTSRAQGTREQLAGEWPELPLAPWKATYESLHLRTQMIGKTRLALSPTENHWWHVALYVTTRGLGTSSIPCDGRTFEVELDFLAHQLDVRTSDGETGSLPLVAQSVAEFHAAYLALLRGLGIAVTMWPVPCEMADAVRFPADDAHASYDPDAAARCWRALVQIDRVMKAFRGRFLGKSSPVHFWWGSFDLAHTRFSGRPAPPLRGVPNAPDYVTLEAYSCECMSVGWWPGGGGVLEPAFYAYAYPEPPGYPAASVRPADAYYHATMREWILPYDAVRRAPNPDAALTAFLQSTYEAAADLAAWNRALLERRSERA